MENLKIKNNLASFTGLEKLGVTNFFTFDNEAWGDMRQRLADNVATKYKQISHNLNFELSDYIYVLAEHNDGVRFVNEENLTVLREFKKNKRTGSINLSTDAIITKTSIPIFACVADCAVIVVIGLDELDGARFIIFIHAGFTGTALSIHKKAIEIAHQKFKFTNENLSCFIFPHISGTNYSKRKKNNLMLTKLNKQDWKGYIVEKGEDVEIHFAKKITDDLKQMGINKIYETGLDTYEQHKAGKLFSYSYAKKTNKDEEKRFMVGAKIQ